MSEEQRTPVPDDDWVVPASYGQERLWFVDQVEPNSPAFNIITSVHLPYPLSAGEIVGAFREVVSRHEALRTSLRAVDGEPRQVVHGSVAVEVAEVDLRGQPPEALTARYDAEAVRPIPLDAPPLWRATLVRLAEAEWRFVFVAHHAIFDGASIPNLRTELTELCRSAVDGSPARLPELAIQYPDFAAWQRDQLSGDALAAHLRHWRAALDGAPFVHTLPTDRPRPARGPAPGADVAVDLPDGLAAAVAELARRLRATPFMLFLAAYATLVHRLSGDREVVVGVPVGGRELPEVQPLIGMFVNTLVLRLDLSGDPSFAALVDRVRGRLGEEWEFQDTPFQKVVEAVAPRRDPSVPPLYQLGFNYLPDVGTGTGNGVARDDLMLGVTDRYVRLEYHATLFTEETARTLVARYLRLLSAAVRAPETPLWSLPLLDPAERTRLDAWERADGTPVVDRAGQPVPVGVVGELPTGELGLRRPDGTVEALGPSAHRPLLNVLRWRQRIEAALRAAPGVADAATAVRETPTGPRLVGYVARPVGDLAKVRAALAEMLPAHLTPDLVHVSALPRAVDGGIDLVALAADPLPAGPPRDGAPSVEEPAPVDQAVPSTATERAIAEIWAEVLGVASAHLDDDFYAVGGHSMLAVRLVARLRRLTAGRSRQIGVMDVVTCRTIRRLAALVDGAQDGGRQLLHELTPPGDRVVSYVCVPYGGGSAAVYQTLADALPPGHALYALAIPGHDVGLDEAALPFDELIDACLAEILDRVPGPVVLYGHCGVGGALAVALARRLEAAGRPVDALYLGAVFPAARAKGVLSKVLRRLDGLASNRVYANWLTGMGVDLSELEPAQADRIVANMRRDGEAAEEYFTGLLAEPGPRLRAPVISVVGERDRVTEFYQERFREWQVVSDTTAVVVIDEAGHYFLTHRADELADILTGTHRAIAAGGFTRLGGPETGWRAHAVHHDPAAGSLAAVPASAGSSTADRADPDPATAGAGAGPPTAAPAGAADKAAGASAAPRNLRTYLAIAAGQLASLTGSALTQWAIPVWIYLETGSYVSFALFAALGIVPTLLVSPLAGALVDRLDRRRVMLLAGLAAGLAELAMGLLLWSGNLRVWHLYVLVVCLTTAASFQRVAFLAATPQLVPKAYLGHANGVNQLATGFANLVAPLLGAGLLGLLGLGGIVLVDVVSYVFAVAVLLVVRFPSTMGRIRDEPLLAAILGGLRFTWGIRGLRSMLLFFAALNVFLGAALIMVSPLVLGFGSLAQVGQVAFAEGVGAALGGLVVIVWGGPTRRRAAGVLIATAAMSACYLLVGLRPALLLVAAGLFGAGLALSVTQGIYATIVQVKVPQRFHGRVFALNQMIAWGTLPIGYAVVGPLGGRLLEPLMAAGGPLASTVGAVIGVGPGRGIGLLYLALAVAMLALTAAARLVPSLARFDQQVPDAPPDDLVGVEQLRRPESTEPVSDPPAARLDELVAAQAARTPSAIALISGTERVTYGELDARAGRLAAALRARGVGPEAFVAIAIDRSVAMVVAALAVLKAGGAYVALDPAQPAGRLASILDSARPVLLLGDGKLVDGAASCPVVDEATLLAEAASSAGSAPLASADGGSERTAYVVYTSGSTGTPKGVLAHHRGIVNHLRYIMREHRVTAADTVLQIASLAFDASVRDLFGPLSVGARVVLLEPDQAKDPAAMLALIRRHRVTCLLAVVPTLLRGMADLATGAAPSVRLVLFAGERLHAADCAAARRIFGPRVCLVNQYGPTECTMTTTYSVLPAGAPVPDPVPLGRPIGGAWVRVLDDALQPVPVGEIGEIYIGGVGVARGYLHRSVETAARFLPDPFGAEPGARMYRTGDQGRVRADGALEFHGRIDDQVKIRGQRVEPGEIEGLLRGHPAVRDAAVLSDGEPVRLLAVVSGTEVDLDDVRAYLRARLPDFLVPEQFAVLDELPRTPNGKIDRRALASGQPVGSAAR
ncbi:non-ribosomal peptide synthetase [Micromonospora narathiwatensis]|uniref:Amino acid adenylation domain-containing protein n=1 Tax=Micromonospora narathiwatensis TaxID=299146 RepID=A0A1A8ZJE7_9ACTN|nr:non-ribosomal peptide synthetase [Micromonospora narathiwatensis]SBT43959.1 amino acid adenylation domain-containing protein [Micromonospora narathiwatensis]